MGLSSACLLVLALCSLLPSAFAAKHGDFKTCQQSSFCRRLRAISTISDLGGPEFHSPYSALEATHSTAVDRDEASWTFPIKTELYPAIDFELRVDIQQGGIARLRMDEVNSALQWKRYNETASHALLGEPKLLSKKDVSMETKKGITTLSYYSKSKSSFPLQLVIQNSPLKITQLMDGSPIAIINDRSLLHMEHFRTKKVALEEGVEPTEVSEMEFKGRVAYEKGSDVDRKWFLGEAEEDEGMWEESWQKWTDSKPKGKSLLSIAVVLGHQAVLLMEADFVLPPK